MPYDLAASIHAQRHSQNYAGMVKTRDDAERYRVIFDKVQPALIVECGTFSGKAAAWLANEAGCHVVTIDTNPVADKATKDAAGTNVTWLVGSSTSTDIIDTVKSIAGSYAHSDPVMVILDSDHSAAHVAAEIAAYAPLVTQGSYLVVEDTIVRWLPGEQIPLGPYTGSPLDSAEHWVADHPNIWKNDDELESMYPTTQHMGGWLQRIQRG